MNDGQHHHDRLTREGLPRRLRSARNDAHRDFGPLVQPDPWSLDDVVQFAPDYDLVVGSDRRSLHRREDCPICRHLGGMHLHLTTRPRSEEAPVDRHLTAAAWDRIAEVVRACRVPKDDGL